MVQEGPTVIHGHIDSPISKIIPIQSNTFKILSLDGKSA